MAKTQINITGKAEDLWKLIPRSMKSKAIELGLISLAQDERYAHIFFEDMEEVEEILNRKETKKKEKKESNKEEKGKSTKIW